MKAAILGDGGWGTALALVLHRNGHEVEVWGPFPEYVAQVETQRENVKFLPGAPLPESIHFTADRAGAVAGADVIVLASPSRFFGDVATSFADLVPAGALVVSVAKGLDRASHERMSQVAERLLRKEGVAALSGPSHAEEVARGVPSAVAIACRDATHAKELQRFFSNDVFRVYTTDDIIGVELGAVMKNVIALAAGVSDGIGYGDNAKAALVTRGLAEMTRLGSALGARTETFSGLSGMGDLIVTCCSNLSRNHTVGVRLGKGERIDDILDSMEQVAEGVWNCRNARDLAQELNVELPITEQVYAVVHEGKDPTVAVRSLLGRDPRAERDG